MLQTKMLVRNPISHRYALNAYCLGFAAKRASCIRRIASFWDNRSTGRFRISSQLISRIVLSVMVFLTAPKSLDVFFIGEFYLMVNEAINVAVIIQSYEQKTRFGTVANHIIEAVAKWHTRYWNPSRSDIATYTLNFQMIRGNGSNLFQRQKAEVISWVSKFKIFHRELWLELMVKLIILFLSRSFSKKTYVCHHKLSSWIETRTYDLRRE